MLLVVEKEGSAHVAFFLTEGGERKFVSRNTLKATAVQNTREKRKWFFEDAVTGKRRKRNA